MARLQLQGVGHSYAGRGADERTWALKPLDLEWEDGVTHALLGPSGCGKTTLLSILSGLLKPTTGRVLIDGRDVTDAAPRARNMAQVFQFPVVYDTMTVAQNLAFPLRNRGLPANQIQGRVHEVAQLLDLDAALELPARRLPVDGRQRLSLGRGLVRTDVAAILLDEPLTQVDPSIRWKLRRRLAEVQERLRPTMIYVTHDQDEALTLAESVVVLEQGRVLQVGSPEELHEQPNNTRVGQLIGSPGMNLLALAPPSTESARGAPRSSARLLGSRQSLSLEPWDLELERDLESERPSAEAASAAGAAALQLGIRPDRIRWAEGMSELHLEVSAVVVRQEDLGHRRLLGLELGETSFVMETDGDIQVSVGTEVRVALPLKDVRLFANGQAVPLKHAAPVEGASS